jgi:Asp-tRNA(Asn)/Glu-tRNA(Gln) amidotransferase A subunit family amidase
MTATDPNITDDTILAAATLLGRRYTAEQRTLMLEGVRKHARWTETLRSWPLENATPPALQFVASPPMHDPWAPEPLAWQPPNVASPESPEALALMPVTHLAALLRTGRVSSMELTTTYLERLKRIDPRLQSVVTLTEALALRQAQRADEELAAGVDRGPLHGIPWGCKDLLAVKGYPTTWGAAPYRDQQFDDDATVVRRLEAAGAVLVAKLSLGELAMGDTWFGGVTKNPWNLDQGSSGSSAGSASAVAAGLVAFAIGSETRGSIVSPCTRCGASGLRPTYGRVSRHGAMTLSWSMDKIGPICRDVDDCALVFAAIYGPDGHDTSVVDLPFMWNVRENPTRMRVGYLHKAFEAEREDAEWRTHDLATLETLRSLGYELVPITLPETPTEALGYILTVEAAASFEELTQRGGLDMLIRQSQDAWPTILRQAQFISAVDYLRANRIRSVAMTQMAALFSQVDVYVAPSHTTDPAAGDNLALTNLTGHPCVVVPNGFRRDGTPTSITFTGGLYDERSVLAIAKAYQGATGFHLAHPPIALS